MIYQSVSGIGLSTASGYGAGWILAAMSNAPVNSGEKGRAQWCQLKRIAL